MRSIQFCVISYALDFARFRGSLTSRYRLAGVRVGEGVPVNSSTISSSQHR